MKQTKNMRRQITRQPNTKISKSSLDASILDAGSNLTEDQSGMYIFKKFIYIPMYYCQSDHGVSNLLGPRKQGVWSKINFSQIKMLSFVVFKYNGLLN